MSHDDSVLNVLNSRVRLLWIVGAPGTGKTACATGIAGNSPLWEVIHLHEYRTDQQDSAIQIDNYKFDNMVNIQYIRNRIRTLNAQRTGIIIDGFPNNLKQAKLFVRYITMPHAIIHLCYSFDGMLARQQYKFGDRHDIEFLRASITRSIDKLQPVLRKYNDRVIKMFAYYSRVKLAEALKKIVDEKFRI